MADEVTLTDTRARVRRANKSDATNHVERVILWERRSPCPRHCPEPCACAP